MCHYIASHDRQTIDISVWNNLKDLESTDALQYTWSKSDHNRKLLTAINIDTRNIVSMSV